MQIALPTAKASLEGIRDRWLAARATALAHSDAVVIKQRRHELHGTVTLGLAVVTVPVSAALPSFPAEQYAWIPVLGGLVAGAAALSKFLEQKGVTPEQISSHSEAVHELVDRLEQLNLMAAHVHEYVNGDRQLEMHDIDADAKRVKAEIADIDRRIPVSVLDDHRKKARELLEQTSLHDALKSVTRKLNGGQGEPSPPPGDLPEEAPGIVPMQARRGGAR